MKKIISVILACLMLTSSCIASVACSKKATDNVVSTASETIDGSTTTIEDTTILRPDLPKKNYDGYEFIILVRDQVDVGDPWGDVEAFVEGENGEAMNDALYARNVVLEDRYNIKIKQKVSKDILGDYKKSVMAQDNLFDIAMMDLFCATSLAQQDMLVDLNTLPYLQFKNPWWDQSSIQDLSIGGKLFFTTGDFSYRNHNASWIYAFNKNLIKDFKLDDPYELVKTGKWTIDKFIEMMKGVALDLDGNGKMDEFDRYGLITEQANTLGMFIGAENFVISKDDEDYPKITINSDKGVSTLAKLFGLMNDNSITTGIASPYMTKYSSDPWGALVKVFSEDRGLFYSIVMYTIKKLRNMPTDFGILPMPKYDENQKQYYTWTSPWIASALCVPITNSDLERTSIITEDLCYESMIHNRPAYYNVSLQGKFTRDTQSSEMIDIILANRVYDLGIIYNWGKVGTLINDMTSSRKDNFTSEYEKIAKKAQLELDKMIEDYKS